MHPPPNTPFIKLRSAFAKSLQSAELDGNGSDVEALINRNQRLNGPNVPLAGCLKELLASQRKETTLALRNAEKNDGSVQLFVLKMNTSLHRCSQGAALGLPPNAAIRLLSLGKENASAQTRKHKLNKLCHQMWKLFHKVHKHQTLLCSLCIINFKSFFTLLYVSQSFLY